MVFAELRANVKFYQRLGKSQKKSKVFSNNAVSRLRLRVYSLLMQRSEEKQSSLNVTAQTMSTDKGSLVQPS